MAAHFEFAHRVAFSPDNAEALLRELPAAPGVFALRGADSEAEPYLTRAADLRRRLRRLLAPPETAPDGQTVLSRRLNLRNRIRWIEWTGTGSDFESTLLLYRASRAAFGAEQARRRLRLHPPYFLRMTLAHAHPRLYATNRLSRKSLAESFGPFPSRAAAERYGDAVLDLFALRRCHEDLVPSPGHPGCVYGEMNKCLRPCQQGAPTACSPAQYSAEAQRVFAFLATRGQSLLDEVARQRDAASAGLDFEAAATLHRHWEKVKAAAALADELVRPVADLRAVILQESAPLPSPVAEANTQTPGGPIPAETCPAEPDPAMRGVAPSAGTASGTAAKTATVAVFLLDHGQLAGPEPLSTLGVRAVREQTAVGSSLFAQPLMLSAIPLDEPVHDTPVQDAAAPLPAASATLSPEDRARSVLACLEAATAIAPEIADFCDALALFRRWYYRPEKQRQGEVFLPNPDRSWPVRRILNGAARIVLGPPAAADPVDREAAKALKTRILHPGREGVEREVPVLPQRSRSRSRSRSRKVMPPTSLLP